MGIAYLDIPLIWMPSNVLVRWRIRGRIACCW
jgi:hypothetical protein